MIPLSDLALEALGKFVYNITMRLGELRHNVNFKDVYLEPTINYIENLMQTNVPPNLASHVVRRLQSCVFDAYGQLALRYGVSCECYRCHKHIQAQILKPAELITTRMWVAVIHPSITSFELSGQFVHSVGGRVCAEMFLNIFVNKILTKMTNLNILKFEYVGFLISGELLNNLRKSENLVEVTLTDCDNSMVTKLSEICQNLKKLDLRESSLVDDSCVTDIVKFRFLEYLNILSTNISELGVIRIIKELPSRLKVFRSLLTPSQVSLLEECIPNLSSLGYHSRNFSSDPLSLKGFENLTCLSVTFTGYRQGFDGLKESLEYLGHQLRELKLRDVCGTDLRFIAEKCPSLRRIGLSFRNSDHLGFPHAEGLDSYTEKFPLPIFPSVYSCEIRIDDYYLVLYILSRFVNMKQLVLNEGYSKLSGFPFRYVLESMKEGRIIELYIKGNRIQLSGCNLLIRRNDGATYLKGIEDFETTVNRFIISRSWLFDQDFF